MRALPHGKSQLSSLSFFTHRGGGECYAEYIEYTIKNWLKRNKDHFLAASVEFLESSEFELIGQIKVKWLKFSFCLMMIPSVQIVSGFAEICVFRGVKDHQEVALETVLRLIMMQQFIM